jgi:hypothetical protein
MKIGIYSEVANMMKDNNVSTSKIDELIEATDFCPIPYFIEFYCMFCLTTNLSVVKKFYLALSNDLLKQKSKLKIDKSIARSKVYEVARLLASCKHKHFNSTYRNQGVNIAAIEALVINYNEKKYEELGEIANKVTKDMFSLFNILFYKLLKKDVQGVVAILNYILSATNLQLADMDNSYFEHVKTCKNDIVWYLWFVLLVFTNVQRDDLQKDFVEYNLNIFSLQLLKKYKAHRLDILYYCFIVICKDKTIKFVKEHEKANVKNDANYLQYIIHK